MAVPKQEQAQPPVSPATRAEGSLLDSLALEAPAISDRDQRDQQAQGIRDEKLRQKEVDRRRAQGKERSGRVSPLQGSAELNEDGTIPFDEDADALPLNSSNADDPVETAATETAKPSLFDDDLPELEALAVEPEPPKKAPPSRSRPSGAPEAAMSGLLEEEQFDVPAQEGAPGGLVEPQSSKTAGDDLDDLVPDLGGIEALPPLIEEEALQESEYRIVCRTCGTPQYVAPSTKGMKIKCPDCYSEFKVPGPPKNWKPKPRKQAERAGGRGQQAGGASQTSRSDMGLANQDLAKQQQEEHKRKARAQQMLDKAADEITQETEESRYQLDFDNTNFAQRTFGFLGDPLIWVQMVGYGFIFAGLFGMYQYASNQSDTQFGKGLMLAVGILAPICGILFALPMLSGGLALIEGVANKQQRVHEIPAFNIFDNFADLLVILFAFGAAIVPGFLVGSALALNGGGEMYLRLIGMFGTTFLLFPIFLLSMMDNGSLFALISGSVLSSLTKAAEAWGGYYMKTFLGMIVVLVAWFILLGGSPILAAIGGALLPPLFFFLCQQIGCLADAIGDHLSFEFVPPDREDHDQAIIE